MEKFKKKKPEDENMEIRKQKKVDAKIEKLNDGENFKLKKGKNHQKVLRSFNLSPFCFQVKPSLSAKC